MGLKDYHKLFIGRIIQSGNENQIRENSQKMATILHEKFSLIVKVVKKWLDKGKKLKLIYYLNSKIFIMSTHHNSIESYEMRMHKEDQTIIAISDSIKNLKHMANTISDTLDDDARLISDLDSEVNHASIKTLSVTNQVQHALSMASDNKSCLLIILLIIVIVIMAIVLFI
jgi:hypothetical protein